MTDRLVHWAEVAPDRTFIARRERSADGSTGDWLRAELRRGAAEARAASARPCSTAASTPSARSRSSARTASSTR